MSLPGLNVEEGLFCRCILRFLRLVDKQRQFRVAGDEQSKRIGEVTLAVSQMERSILQNLLLVTRSAENTQARRAEAFQLTQDISSFKVANT